MRRGASLCLTLVRSTRLARQLERDDLGAATGLLHSAAPAFHIQTCPAFPFASFARSPFVHARAHAAVRASERLMCSLGKSSCGCCGVVGVRALLEVVDGVFVALAEILLVISYADHDAASAADWDGYWRCEGVGV